jgi:hypothetical protein
VNARRSGHEAAENGDALAERGRGCENRRPEEPMTRALTMMFLVAAIAGCGGGGGGPIDVPMVAAGAGEYEADCQTLCTPVAGEAICNAEHVEFCVAKCRARTNGLAQTCATCLFTNGSQITGYMQGEDSYCSIGGPADVDSCVTECDDAGAVATPPEFSVQCDLECGFYVQNDDPFACSADGSAACRADCAAAIAANGRICSQCLIDQTIPTSFCFDNDCDCEPQFDSDTTFGCMELCDAI